MLNDTGKTMAHKFMKIIQSGAACDATYYMARAIQQVFAGGNDISPTINLIFCISFQYNKSDILHFLSAFYSPIS
jgi:hypothetical protein